LAPNAAEPARSGYAWYVAPADVDATDQDALRWIAPEAPGVVAVVETALAGGRGAIAHLAAIDDAIAAVRRQTDAAIADPVRNAGILTGLSIGAASTSLDLIG
jgi:hypothetical protein